MFDADGRDRGWNQRCQQRPTFIGFALPFPIHNSWKNATLNSAVLHSKPLHPRSIRTIRPLICATASLPETDGPSVDAPTSPLISGTPCFTRDVLASPMPYSHRVVYLDAVTDAVERYLSSELRPHPLASAPAARINLLAPQLNPSLDIYDRRFLLQLVWAVVQGAVARCNRRTRVLIQGRRAFGAIPLSVSGLHRNFDADLETSRAEWPENSINSGELENPADLTEEDEVIVIVSPTNAVSIPVIQSVMDLVNRAGERPVIIINPRLSDVPSPGGVMQVQGRGNRLEFLEALDDILYLRLLYKPGKSYPPRGILYHSWSEAWQIWKSINVDENYLLVSTVHKRPSPSDISEAFKREAFTRQIKRAKDINENDMIDNKTSAVMVLVGFVVLAVAAALPLLRGASLDALLRSPVS